MNLKLPLEFTDVAIGKTATAEIATGNKRIKGVVLEFGATNAAASAEKAFDEIIGDIFVITDDSAQRTHTAKELDDINKDMGALYQLRTYDPSSPNNCLYHLPIYFAKPWLKRKIDAEQSAWLTDGMRSFQIEAKILSTDIANVVLNGYYVYDEVQGDGQLIEKWIRFNKTASGTRNTFTNLLDAKDVLQQVTLYNPTGATITNAKLKHGGKEVFDLTKRRASSFNQHFAEMNIASESSADTGRFHMVFDESGDPTDGLPMGGKSNELTLDYSASASGTITGLVQRYGLPE